MQIQSRNIINADTNPNGTLISQRKHNRSQILWEHFYDTPTSKVGMVRNLANAMNKTFIEKVFQKDVSYNVCIRVKYINLQLPTIGNFDFL